MWISTVIMGLNAVGCLVAPMYWGLAKANELMPYITFGLSFGLHQLGSLVAHYPCFRILAKEVEEAKRQKQAAEAEAKARQTRAQSATSAPGIASSAIEGVA